MKRTGIKLKKYLFRWKAELKCFLYRSGYSGNLLQRTILSATVFFCLCSVIASAQTTYKEINTKGSSSPGLVRLYDFNTSNDGDAITNIEVISPWLFTLHENGGIMGYGSILKTKTDGSEFIRWWMWDSSPNDLEASGQMLYGTKRLGGLNENGLIYKTSIDGTEWKTIFNFPSRYTWPRYDLTVYDTIIYGTAREALAAYGYVFSINTDGSEFHEISNISDLQLELVHDNYIFGRTWVNSVLRIFRMKTDGTDFTVLDYFNDLPAYSGAGSFILVDDFILGWSSGDGVNGIGTLWKMSSDGSSFSKLYDFSSIEGIPMKIVLEGSFIYGVATEGGEYSLGRIFRFNKDGSGYQKIFDFQEESYGLWPFELVMSGDTIFGLTAIGGANNAGTIFRYNIGDLEAPVKDSIRVKKLLIKSPEEIILDTKGSITVEKGSFLNLDTNFIATGNVAYTYDWKVKSVGGYEIINRNVQITSDRTYYIFLTTVQGCSYVDSLIVVAKQSTGIGEETDNTVNIYPNPNSGSFRVILPSGNKSYSYEIIDVSGTKVDGNNIFCYTGDCTYTIKLDNAKPGVYTLVIRAEGQFTSRQKFVISR